MAGTPPGAPLQAFSSRGNQSDTLMAARPDPTLLSTPLAAPRLALEHLPVPVLVFEPSYRLNFINAAARTYFGLSNIWAKPEGKLIYARFHLFE